MLIARAILDRIMAGEIDLAFRRWVRPTVRTGGTLRTSAGMLRIGAVERVGRRSITAADARRAGFATRAALMDELDRRDSGDIYRIEVAPGGADPLISLRSDADLSATDVEAIRTILDGLDARAAERWTGRYLDLIRDQPHVRAEDLARAIGCEKVVFKRNVRKLKRLGLTISHSPGYELSPRGRAFLDHTTDGGRST